MIRSIALLIAVTGTSLGITTTDVNAQGQSDAAILAAEANITQLPIREITLYRSGVGSFLREGRFSGAARVALRFETEQINDILKSMVLLDLGGGRVDSVTYGSKEPLSRRLESFGVDISAAPTIADLFKQLRGAPLRIQSTDGQLEGTILSVEDRVVVEAAGDGAVPIKDQFVNLVTSAGVRSIAISRIASFELADEKLARELNEALAALAEHRADRTKTVELTLSGPDDRARSLIVGYVHEMPVWKTSYRLVLPEETGNPTLQGWAIVENTTDEDWENVRLSLASGRPVAFTMDLYEPIFAPRPIVPVPVAGGLLPKIYEGASQFFSAEVDERYDDARKSMVGRAAEMAMNQATDASGFPNRLVAPAPTIGEGQLNDYLNQSQASGGEVGEQFMYTVDAPVSLARQRSAMLPIILTPIEGRRVSIYHRTDTPKHPMRGVEMVNNAGLHLMPGPISVYDGNSYAGDAQIPHTSRNQKQMLSYALDIDVHSRTEAASDESIMKLKIVDGMIEQTNLSRMSVTYHFENLDSSRGRTMVIEHPKNQGWDLVQPQKPADTTDTLYRFELDMDKTSKADLVVTEERTWLQRLAVTSYELPTLVAFAKNGKASQKVVDAIRKAADIQSRINIAESRINELDRERDSISSDQSRIRSNMDRLDRQSDLYRRYLSKLQEQETRLEDMLQSRRALETERDQARAELNEYLRNLNVE